MIRPCLTLNIIRYISRVKWTNPKKGVALSPTCQCSSYWKGSLWVALDYGYQLYFFMHVLMNILFLFLVLAFVSPSLLVFCTNWTKNKKPQDLSLHFILLLTLPVTNSNNLDILTTGIYKALQIHSIHPQ